MVLPANATLVMSEEVIVISCVPLNATPLIDLAVCNCVAEEALPVTEPTRLAVIVPAAKLPLASRATTLLAVLVEVASTEIVAGRLPLNTVKLPLVVVFIKFK